MQTDHVTDCEAVGPATRDRQISMSQVTFIAAWRRWKRKKTQCGRTNERANKPVMASYGSPTVIGEANAAKRLRETPTGTWSCRSRGSSEDWAVLEDVCRHSFGGDFHISTYSRPTQPRFSGRAQATIHFLVRVRAYMRGTFLRSTRSTNMRTACLVVCSATEHTNRARVRVIRWQGLRTSNYPVGT